MGQLITVDFSKKREPEKKPAPPTDEEFSERLVRIRRSLEKINSLMSELKRQKGS